MTESPDQCLQASLYVEVAACGCSEYLCASHDEIIAGMKPERPWRMNCTTPLSGPLSVQQFARYEPGRAHDQHPHERTYLPDAH